MADCPPESRRIRTHSREITRRLLLDAAARKFAREGFAAASVQEVAAAAGFSVGAVYSNFANKEELFAAVMTGHTMDEVALIIDWAQADRADPLRALSAGVVSTADNDIDTMLLRVESWLGAVRNPNRMATETAASRKALDAIRSILDIVLRHRGVDEPALLDDFAMTALSLFRELIRLRRVCPDRVTEDTFRQALQWQITGMLNAPLVDSQAQLHREIIAVRLLA